MWFSWSLPQCWQSWLIQATLATESLPKQSSTCPPPFTQFILPSSTHLPHSHPIGLLIQPVVAFHHPLFPQASASDTEGHWGQTTTTNYLAIYNQPNKQTSNSDTPRALTSEYLWHDTWRPNMTELNGSTPECWVTNGHTYDFNNITSSHPHSKSTPSCRSFLVVTIRSLGDIFGDKPVAM